MISSHHGDDSLLHQNKKGGTLFTTYTHSFIKILKQIIKFIKFVIYSINFIIYSIKLTIYPIPKLIIIVYL